MLTCATLTPVKRYIAPDDPILTAHQVPAELATMTLMDMVASARALEAAIIARHDEASIARIRETAMSQAEAYLDYTAEAATHTRALKP